MNKLHYSIGVHWLIDWLCDHHFTKAVNTSHKELESKWRRSFVGFVPKVNSVPVSFHWTWAAWTVKPELSTISEYRPPFHYFGVPFSTFRVQRNHWCTTTTCPHRPQFWGPEGGRCIQVWVYKKSSLCNSQTQRGKVLHRSVCDQRFVW